MSRSLSSGAHSRDPLAHPGGDRSAGAAYCPEMLSPRNVLRFLHTRMSAMTFMAAARTSAQSAAFDTISIVPSTSMPWTTLPATMTTASDIWAMRHVRRPNRRRSAARSATAKIAHIAITPKGENGVGDANRRASIMSGGLVIQRPATWTTTATTSAANIRQSAKAEPT